MLPAEDVDINVMEQLEKGRDRKRELGSDIVLNQLFEGVRNIAIRNVTIKCDIRSFIGNIGLDLQGKMFPVPSQFPMTGTEMMIFLRDYDFRFSNNYRFITSKILVVRTILQRILKWTYETADIVQEILIPQLREIADWNYSMAMDLAALPKTDPTYKKFSKLMIQLPSDIELIGGTVKTYKNYCMKAREKHIEGGYFETVESLMEKQFKSFGGAFSKVVEVASQVDPTKEVWKNPDAWSDQTQGMFLSEFQCLGYFQQVDNALREEYSLNLREYENFRGLVDHIVRKTNDVIEDIKNLLIAPKIEINIDLVSKGVEKIQQIKNRSIILDPREALGEQLFEYVRQKVEKSTAGLNLKQRLEMLHRFFMGELISYPGVNPMIKSFVKCWSIGSDKECTLFTDVSFQFN